MTARRFLFALILGVIGLLPSVAYGEAFKWEMKPEYVGEIHLGYKTTTKVSGMDTYSGMVELGTLQGVSLNEYLEFGIGVDAFMLTHYYKGEGLRFGADVYFDMRPQYPVNDRFKVFLDLGLGAYFNIHSSPKLDNGFYCQFGPGVRYRNWNLSLGLQNFNTGSGTTAFFTKIGLYF